MNAVEIEEAVSHLAEQPFDAQAFPYAFLEAFGNKATTIKRLRSGTSNKSDLGGVLQTNNIHIKVCESGTVTDTLITLKESPATAKARAKFVLATDGEWLEAEDLKSGETIACDYPDFHERFGFFLPLAGISTVKQIRDSDFDVKATGKLNKLYIELLRTNPEWGTAERRREMNHFMARLIFCFFAEDTDIFTGDDLFTSTIETMSDRDSSNTHEVIGELFRAMNTERGQRKAEDIAGWVPKNIPYVNGGLFSDSVDVPRFTKMARSYILHIGNLDWKKVNPDIFGSMIQAVADDDERGALGMHYTSVSNILKVLNPLFLDDLREQLEEAGDNSRKLLNLRKRMAKVRVFDPACGSGNFLVIAYKEMRKLEAQINERRGERDRRTEIPITNFRGIELRDFPAEIARLALIIAEYQCDVLYRGQQEALKDVLPLNKMNWITCGNALRLDWLSICKPTGVVVKHHADDLFYSPIDQAEIDFENEGGETYICGNPPFSGSVQQTNEQKDDIKAIFSGKLSSYKDLDYVAAFFEKAADYVYRFDSAAAFVSTNSICQGEQVTMLWPSIFERGVSILFAHTSFEWANLAANNAGVTCVVVGISRAPKKRTLFMDGFNLELGSISPYLVPGPELVVRKSVKPISNLPKMITGNLPSDGGNFLLDLEGKARLLAKEPRAESFLKSFTGANEFTNGKSRWCIWIDDDRVQEAMELPELKQIIENVREHRRAAKGSQARSAADTPWKFVFRPHENGYAILVPKVSTSNRDYLPIGLVDDQFIISDLARVIYKPQLWHLSLISSSLHLCWIATVCGRFRTGYRYSHTLGWNTFPVPKLTEKNEADLARCAENILLAREANFPATVSELYHPEKMPENLRAAHDRNDEVVERIYIGRRFKNDTERLEKLFQLYTKMTNTKETNSERKAVT